MRACEAMRHDPERESDNVSLQKAGSTCHFAMTAGEDNDTPVQPQPRILIRSRNGDSLERSSGELETRETDSLAVA